MKTQKTQKTQTTTEQMDNLLKETIIDRVRWDIRVSNSDLRLNVKDGIVILNGYFDEAFRHLAATKIILTTNGVLDLIDRSEVLSDYYRSDQDFEDIINRQLLALPLLDNEWIDVKVVGGTAVLTRRVYRPRFKSFAARAVWELSGIKDCVNSIEIGDLPESFENVLNLPSRNDVTTAFALHN